MKLFKIPWPWDWHKAAALVIMAKSKEEALALGRKEAVDSYHEIVPEWNAIEEIKGPVYIDGGCDC